MAVRLKERRFSSRDDWHRWLEENHEQKEGIWLIFFKKVTGRSTLSREEALEEALCFGWIDSVVRRIDEESYAFKFTPRRPGSKWSEANKRAAKRLIDEGRMTLAGRAKLGCALDVETAHRPEPQADEVPDFMRIALERDEEAWRYFSDLPPSYQRDYTRWVSSAKRAETRERRLEEARQLLRQKERLGMK